MIVIPAHNADAARGFLATLNTFRDRHKCLSRFFFMFIGIEYKERSEENEA